MTVKDIHEQYGYSLDKLKDKCAKIINNEWRYSWHWGKHPEERHWTMDAMHDCQNRFLQAEKELNELRALKNELNDICTFFYPESEEELIK